jgi:DNA-binding MarR family transcriptional regulator
MGNMSESDILSMVSRIHRHGNKFIETELENRGIQGIAPSHGDILFQLYTHQSLTMHELSKRVDRDKSTVTVLVGKLVKFGYVKKVQDPLDARIYRVSMTPKGEALRPVFEEISMLLLSAIYTDFSADEKAQLIGLLKKINL